MDEYGDGIETNSLLKEHKIQIEPQPSSTAHESRSTESYALCKSCVSFSFFFCGNSPYLSRSGFLGPKFKVQFFSQKVKLSFKIRRCSQKSSKMFTFSIKNWFLF